MDNKKLSLSFSTCPNDTFMFHALVKGIIETELKFDIKLTDIEDLNKMAFKRENDITKISFSALGNLLDDYVLLRSGSALGRGCGPLIVGKKGCDLKNLKNKRIAIPGINTTAALLLRLYAGADLEILSMPFYEIMPSVQKGETDFGVIIHEGRFTYPDYNLESLLDLGQWWEDYSGLPIPLGGIAAKRSLGKEIILHMEDKLSKSIDYAFKNREASRSYIKEYAQEMDDGVVKEHIDLYVNDFSINLGEEGEKAIKMLFNKAQEKGIIKGFRDSIFIE